MYYQKFFLTIFCFVVAACSSGPTQPDVPADPVIEAGIITMPSSFRSANIYEVVADSLEGVAMGRFYPNFVRAQRFSYDNQFITGHVVEYASAADVMRQHEASLGAESALRLNADSPLLAQFNPRFSIDATGRPTLYFIAGPYAIHITVTPNPDSPETARFFALLFAEDMLVLNAGVMTRPPYFVQLGFTEPPVPSWGTVVPRGDDLIVDLSLDYALLDADQGQVSFVIERGEPFLRQEQVVDVVRGMGAVSFSDTLRFSSDIPDTGTNVTVKVVLTPPYLSESSSSFYTIGIDQGNGLYEHTAQSELRYRLE